VTLDIKILRHFIQKNL